MSYTKSIILIIASMRTDSENFSIQSEFGKSFEIRTTEQQIKDSKHPIVLISDLFEHKR